MKPRGNLPPSYRAPGRRSRRSRGSRPPLRPRRAISLRVLAALRRVGAALETMTDPTPAAWATLVGFTAGEGLAMNRAFLLLSEGDWLRGTMGVGPSSRAEAASVWSEIAQDSIKPLEEISNPPQALIEAELQRHRALLEQLAHPMSGACSGWSSAFVARPGHPNPCVAHWLTILESPALLVSPMRGADRPWGAIIADNFVTRTPISPAVLQAAETLTHGLRIALERTELFERLAEEHRHRTAAEQSAALAEAARGLAHDLKNPLALAGGLARELADAPPADRSLLEHHLATIADAVSRAEERVGRLADGLALKAAETAVEAVDVGEVCDRIVDLFRHLALCRNVRLVCYRPARPLIASASAPSLERCLENLIGNALQALSGRSGTIQVSASGHDEKILVEVADDGPPLPVGLKPDPFSGGFSSRSEGTGLGLASVRRLVASMGGQIEYDEKEPGWVRFSISLRRWA